MDAWRDIRLKARECHRQALVKSKGVRKAPALLAAALEDEDLQLTALRAGLGRQQGRLWISRPPLEDDQRRERPEPENEAVVTAHELGHYKLHHDPRNEVTALAPGLGGDPIDSGAGRVEGYSPRERKEVQADIFAGEFLCPADWLREELLVAWPQARGHRQRHWRAAGPRPESDRPRPAPAAPGSPSARRAQPKLHAGSRPA